MSIFTDFINRFRGKTIWIGGSGAYSAPKNRAIEEMDQCSAILDTNATHIARGRILHVVKDRDGRIKETKWASEYTKLFNRPNPMMSGKDFLYAMAWQLQYANTALAWVKWDARMHPIEVWPLVYLQFELRKTENGEYVVLIHETDGKELIVRTEDLIVLRRKYTGDSFAGVGNEQITEVIEMTGSMDEALVQAAQISNKIHGFVKHKNSMLAPESTKNQQETFADRMRAASENGGIIALDGTEEYQPLSVATWTSTAAQQDAVFRRLYTFWRTPEEVVRNTANEQTMQNYYESVVEPVWEIMEAAFTKALFTDREQDFGNRIVVYSGVATGASWQTKLNILNSTKEVGELTVNERRELIGYGPVEDGDERLVSLNYVKAKDQSKYQTGGENDG